METEAATIQKAADLLPVNWDETTAGAQTRGNNNFRINKIMALAYLGKNLLFAGSGLMSQADMYRLGGVVTAFNVVLYLTLGTMWLLLVAR